MICKKCANIFDDSLLACPMCGWSMNNDTQQPKKAEPFKVNINDEAYYGQEPVQNASVNTVRIPAKPENTVSHTQRNPSPPTRPVPFEQIQPMGNTARPNTEPPAARTVARPVPQVTRITHTPTGNVIKRTQTRKAPIEDFVQYPTVQSSDPIVKKAIEADRITENETDIAARKRASSVIVIMVCVLAVIMAALTVVSAKTDVFKEKSDTVKTTPLIGLSSEDCGSLEKQLTTLNLADSFVFDSGRATPNEFLAFIKPYDSKGLYSRMYSQSTKITVEPDPAKRFIYTPEQEEGYEGYSYNGYEEESYAYYKIAAEEIDRILDCFGLPQAHTANDEDYYYCDGYYYFAHKAEQSVATDDYIIDVASSSRIEDGSYYVECNRLNQQSTSSLQSNYLIVEKSDDSEMPWVIKKVSSEPVFDKNGNMNAGDSAVSYTMQTKTVEATADDGTVYCRYTVRYPQFGGDSKGEQAADRLFSDLLNSINAYSENAKKDYETYINCGGDKSALPFISETVCFVSYSEKGYICVFKESADNLPDLEQLKKDYEEQQEHSDYYYDSEEEEEKEVVMPKRSFEAYCFDKQSGDFVNKDSIIGKDYQTAYELLYRIYNGYDYTQVKDELTTTQAVTDETDYYGEETTSSYYESDSYYNEETTKVYEEVPEDEEELGKKIYESANAMSDEGYLFCFVTEEGYAERVVIPYDIEGFFQFEE